MLTCRRRCSKTLWTAPPKPWRSSTSRRTSPPTSRRSSTRSTTPLGIASWAGTSAATSRTRPSTSSTSTWVKWPSSFSSPADSFSRLRRRKNGQFFACDPWESLKTNGCFRFSFNI